MTSKQLFTSHLSFREKNVQPCALPKVLPTVKIAFTSVYQGCLIKGL